MQSQHGKSRKIALCGMFAALSLVCMLMGSVIPFSTFLSPAISGILILPVVIEFGAGAGLLLYAAIALLSLFMVPDKEMALMFLFLLGWYPLVKLKLDKLRFKIIQLCVKFALFNVSIFSLYAIILFLFPIAVVVAEFEQAGLLFILGLLLAGNVTFVIYDTALFRFLQLYYGVWRPKLMRMH